VDAAEKFVQTSDKKTWREEPFWMTWVWDGRMLVVKEVGW